MMTPGERDRAASAIHEALHLLEPRLSVLTHPDLTGCHCGVIADVVLDALADETRGVQAAIERAIFLAPSYTPSDALDFGDGYNRGRDDLAQAIRAALVSPLDEADTLQPVDPEPDQGWYFCGNCTEHISHNWALNAWCPGWPSTAVPADTPEVPSE